MIECKRRQAYAARQNLCKISHVMLICEWAHSLTDSE